MGLSCSGSMRFCLKAIFLILPFLAGGQSLFYPVPPPKHYICYQVGGPIRIDGKLEEADWQKGEWTDYFMDITGPSGVTPYYDTQVKMLWDSQYFYIGAVLQEAHIWAKLTKRDEVIYYDNDFEIFIDPDGDNHHYMELEINALNTVWDLFLKRPYRDTTHANSNFDLPNLLTAVEIKGTLNNPGDKDERWSVEIAIPWADITAFLPETRRPLNQQQWRINFSRVQWETTVKNGKYKKKKGKNGKPLPELNWVWSPQWAINMHQPEFWGYVQFSTETVGTKEVPFFEDMDFNLKMALLEIYREQKSFFNTHGHFAKKLEDLALDPYNREHFGQLITLETQPSGFTARANGLKAIWKINEKSHLTFQDYLH